MLLLFDACLNIWCKSNNINNIGRILEHKNSLVSEVHRYNCWTQVKIAGHHDQQETKLEFLKITELIFIRTIASYNSLKTLEALSIERFRGVLC